MKKIKMIVTLVALMMTTTVSAQTDKDYQSYPHNFIGIQGGMMKNYSGILPDRKFSPEVAISLGRFFIPEVGARLTAAGTKWTADVPGVGDYDSKMLDLSLDLLLNFSNIFFPNRHNTVNVIGVAGMPWQMAAPHTYVDTYGGSTVQGYEKWNSGWKGGGMVEFDVAKHFGVNLEVGSMYVHNRQHSANNKDRWWPYAMAGLTYKFGFKKAKKEEPVVIKEYVAPTPAPAPAAVEKKPEPKPQPAVVAPAPQTKKEEVKAPEKIERNVFFVINKSDVNDKEQSKLAEVVAFAKANPNAKFTVTGYADKGTGTAAVNKRIAEQRAQSVKTKLVYSGIEATRISTSSKGDTVQPFANNDDNRVVIIIGEE
jgi:OOP family OmpA-OmpF porin